MSRWHQEHPTYSTRWARQNPEKHRQYSRDYRKRNPEVAKLYYEKNKERLVGVRKARHQRLKFFILHYYSGGKPKCACCGINDIEFLTIDHINGGGGTHRKSMKAYSIYVWLKRENLPEGYRVLCMNCNFALGKFGYCPHHKEEIQVFA